MKQRIALLLVATTIFSFIGAESKKYTQDQIDDLAAQGTPLTFQAGKKDAGIKLTIKDGSVTFEGVSVKSKDLTKAAKLQAKLLKRKNTLSSFSMGKSIHMGSGRDMVADGTSYEAKEKIVLSAGQTMNLKNTIMNSPVIQLEGRVLKASTCIIQKPKSFEIKGKNDSIIERITLTFSPKKNIQCGLEGTIDLEEGTTEKEFIVFGASQISVFFAEPDELFDQLQEAA